MTRQERNKKISRQFCAVFGVGLAISLLLYGAPSASAASLAVTPSIIDLKAEVRDILKESLTLTNNTARKLNVYAFVNNIAIQGGKQEFLDPSRADQSSSLANWIMIRRGVIELLPGEKKNIDFSIEVNLRAEPGMYHALISFADASTRDEAEARMAGAPSLTINLEVPEDIKERLQLKSFAPTKIFFPRFPVTFLYELENIGNRPISFSGEIRIYDRQGLEITSIPINNASAVIDPQANLKLASHWQGPEPGNRLLAQVVGGFKGIGRYKAFLDLAYGSKERGTLQDTLFFWVIPWPLLLVVFGALLVLVVMMAYIIHRQYEKRFRHLHHALHTYREAAERKVINSRRTKKS